MNKPRYRIGTGLASVKGICGFLSWTQSVEGLVFGFYRLGQVWRENVDRVSIKCFCGNWIWCFGPSAALRVWLT